MGSNSDLAERFFAAAVAGDADSLRSMCSADLQMTTNGGPSVDLAGLLDRFAAFQRVMPDFRYENPVRSDTADGFVVEHDGTGTLADGTEIRSRVCVIATVNGGRLTSVRQYSDSAAAAPIFEALAALGQP